MVILPLMWSVNGFGAAMSFGITEDIGLFAAGLAGTALILYKERAAKKETVSVGRTATA
jgi:hypothetical protein